LLDCDFPDENIRNYATKVLRKLPDERLEDFLLQLTQVGEPNIIQSIYNYYFAHRH